jgi:outer membrane biosynthesis protein TonB
MRRTRNCVLKIYWEDFMKKQVRSLYIGALAMFLSVGMGLNAQNSAPPTQPPDAQAQQPSTPDQTPPQATPEQAQQPTPPPQAEPAPSAPAPGQTGQAAPDTKTETTTAVQSFSGTVVKSGDKYVLQDTDTGNTYDVDHQDEVAKFEGKRVKVKGTLDASGKMIHIQ